MKTIRTLGLALILAVFALFISLLFMGQYKLTNQAFEDFRTQKNIASPLFSETLKIRSLIRNFRLHFSSQILLQKRLSLPMRLTKKTKNGPWLFGKNHIAWPIKW